MAPSPAERAARRHQTEWCLWVEDADPPDYIAVRLSDDVTLHAPGDLTGAALLWMSRPERTRGEILRLLYGDEQTDLIVAEYGKPLDGIVDEDTLADLVSVPIRQVTGLNFQGAMSLASAAARYWVAVQQEAGWHVDIRDLPARRFCALVAATLADTKTEPMTERVGDLTDRLVAMSARSDIGTPVRRRRRRRRRRPPQQQQKPPQGANP